MADDKTKKGARDRNQVAAGEKYELDYIAKELGVNKQVIEAAIKKVGNNRQAIIAEIKSKK